MNVLAYGSDVLASVAVFVLIVLGLALVVNLMGLFNFAHGELLLIGALASYSVQHAGGSAYLGLLAAPAAGFCAGIVLDRSVLRFFYARPVAAILLTYAIGLAIREAVRLYLNGRYLPVAAPAIPDLMLFGAAIPGWRVGMIGIAVVVCAAAWWVFMRTDIGLLVRASLDNEELTSATGVAVDRLRMWAFAASAAMAALAGALIAPVLSLGADMGLPFLVKAFLAVVLGAAGGLLGGVLAGVVIGLASALLPWIVEPVVADIALAIVVIGLIRIFPDGVRLRRVTRPVFPQVTTSRSQP
jgi:branched-chain amino acid transport system permease protein